MIQGTDIIIFPQLINNERKANKNKVEALVFPEFKVEYADPYPRYKSGMSGHWGKDVCTTNGAKTSDNAGQGREGGKHVNSYSHLT